MKFVQIVAIALTAGCATPPALDKPFVTVQHEMPLDDLIRTCNHGMLIAEPDLLGCYKWINNVCHIYMLPRWVREARSGDLSGYHETLGHELDHCRRGAFHGSDLGHALAADFAGHRVQGL